MCSGNAYKHSHSRHLGLYGKPDLLFLTLTRLDAYGVRECYRQGPEEGWESDRLAFWPVTTLSECTLGLTAVTRAAHECYSQLQPE